MTPTRVLVIGPDDHAHAIAELARKRFPDLQLTPCTYDDEVDAPKVFADNWRHHNVAVFTGPAPYYSATEVHGQPIPAVFVPFTGATLVRALFEIVRSTGDVPGVTIDSVDRKGVDDTLLELDIDPSVAELLEYQQTPSRAKIVEFHGSAQREGRASWALTGLRSAYEQLSSEGYRVRRIEPPVATWMSTLSRARDRGRLWIAKRHQLVTVLVQIDPLPSNGDEASVRDDVARLAIALDSHPVELGDGRYLLFTTRGMVEDHWNGGLYSAALTTFPTVWPHGARAHVGVGIGFSARQAHEHGKQALARGRAQATGGVFVIDSDKTFTGPIGSEDPSRFALRSTSPIVRTYAQACELGTGQMERVLTALTRTGSDAFSTNEIAPLLQMTPRNTRRILAKLEAAGLIELVGSEQVHLRGRPRRVYRSQLPNALSEGESTQNEVTA